MKRLFTLILIVFASNAFGQILDDSTAQVIGYWHKGDKQSYVVSLQEIKLKETDTTSNETLTYDVDITVLDSTESSYTIEWYYHNYNTSAEDDLARQMVSTFEALKVVIETDELGSFKTVKNWEEVRDHMKVGLHQIRKVFKGNPKADQIFEQMAAKFTTKEAIESVAIQDVQQFYTYHGGLYVLDDVLEFTMQVPNVFNPEEPFDSQVLLSLDELNPEEENFIIRSSQEIDPEQLTDATLGYLEQLTKSMGAPAPSRDDVGKLTNVTTTAARLHDSGWPIYSIQTTTVEAPGVTNIKERIIEIK